MTEITKVMGLALVGVMQKVVINKCYGGFGISKEAVEWLRENGYEYGEECTLPGEYYDDGSGPAPEFRDSFGSFAGDRDDEGLVKVVEELGTDADGAHAELKVVEVPEGVEWTIDEYDGVETLREKSEVFG